MRRAVVLALVLAVASCATVGTGDPVLVKAEDGLSNSLPFYNAAMTYHFANSTTETPQTYAVFERVRTQFPIAWQALYNGTREYRRVPDRAKLETLLAVVEGLLNDVRPLMGAQ